MHAHVHSGRESERVTDGRRSILEEEEVKELERNEQQKKRMHSQEEVEKSTIVTVAIHGVDKLEHVFEADVL